MSNNENDKRLKTKENVYYNSTSTHQGSESQQIQFSSDSNLCFRSGEPVVTVGCENEGSKVVFQAI